MKTLIQRYLIGGGIVGLVVTLPTVGYGWMMHSGFGGDLTTSDRLLFCLPFICVIAIVAGVLCRRSDQKKDKHE